MLIFGYKSIMDFRSSVISIRILSAFVPGSLLLRQ
jgi:hypothetical protein